MLRRPARRAALPETSALNVRRKDGKATSGIGMLHLPILGNAGYRSLWPAAMHPESAMDHPGRDRLTSPTLRAIVPADLCTGCGLCAGISRGGISMAIDARGYARPRQHHPISDQTEAAIAAACPGRVVAPWPEDESDRPVHVSWGPITRCLTGHATSPDVRHAGSSGGILSALAIHALDTGMVTAVAHIAADDANDPLRNRAVISRDAAAIIARAGSRYAPSPALESIGDLLDGEERVLLIGKPCDISAMRQLARVDARVNQRIVLMLSFFCGGMPSVHGTHAIITAMGLQPDRLTGFRYRGNGWPGTALATAADGSTATMSYADSWGRYLSGRVQYRCKICPDAVGGVADIACADAWYGGESGYPQFDEREGRSLALARSDAGIALLNAAMDAGAIACESLPIAHIDLMQPAQARRKRLVLVRSLAARLLLQRQPSFRALRVGAAGKTAGFGEALRNFAGSLLRIVQGRR